MFCSYPGEFFVVEQICLGAGSEDEIDMLIGRSVADGILDHAPEWRDAGAGTDQEKILLLGFFVQCEDTLRAAEGHFRSDLEFLPHVIGAQSLRIQHDDEFEFVRPVGSGGDGVTAPAFVGFFVDREVEGHELSGDEIKVLEFRNTEPESEGIGRFFFDARHHCGAPGLCCHIGMRLLGC